MKDIILSIIKFIINTFIAGLKKCECCSES